MSKLSSIEELFAGRHFDREVIIVRSLVPALQAQLPGPGRDDG